jgi:NAD(P)-dependent dehydrogenase (short-subunit alcohol dehydrogenase family)
LDEQNHIIRTGSRQYYGQSIAQDIPIGRISKPEELGALVAFLRQNKPGILLGHHSDQWRLGPSGVLRLD